MIAIEMASLNPTDRFTGRALDYARYRPNYPLQVIEFLRGAFALTAHHRIADIGSGTGILSRLFLEHGNSVVGIEPNAEMRTLAEQWLRSYPKFQRVNAIAESTGLPDSSVDFVIVGQAFHWFDRGRSRAEWQRILRGPRVVALVSNRRVVGDPFMDAYEQLLCDHVPEYRRVRSTYECYAALDEFFAPATAREWSGPHCQEFDGEGLRGRLLSSSYFPRPEQPGFAAVEKALHELFERFEQKGQVRVLYRTTVQAGLLPEP